MSVDGQLTLFDLVRRDGKRSWSGNVWKARLFLNYKGIPYQTHWVDYLTLKSTLISLQSLLCSPEPNDPQDAEVAKHYTTSRASFEETARYWAQIYAGAPPKEGSKAPVKPTGTPRDEIAIAGLERAHVDQFESLGFERSKVVSLL